MKKHPWVEAERKFYENRFKELSHKLDFNSYKTVLDYGTGTGGFASLLAEKYPHLKILAVDSNSDVIKLARRHYLHIPNLKFIVSDRLPDGKFDIIFYNLILHELDGKGDKNTIKSFLEKSYNKLKEDGIISILDNRKISRTNFRKLFDKNRNPKKRSFQEEYKEHNQYTMKDWKGMLEEVGFETEYHKELQPNLFKYIGIKRIIKK